VDLAVSDRVTDPWTLHAAPPRYPDKEASTTP
jgi:hypothetical protein